MTQIINNNSNTSRTAWIGQFSVTSKYPFILYSHYSGIISEHRTVEALCKAEERHARGCKRQGGYSDAVTYEWSNLYGGRWEVIS